MLWRPPGLRYLCLESTYTTHLDTLTRTTHLDLERHVRIVDGDLEPLVPERVERLVDDLGLARHLAAHLELDVRVAGA